MDNFDLFDLKPSKATRQKRRDKRLHEEVIETGRFKTAKSARNIKKWNDSGRKKTLQQEMSIDSLRNRESIRDGRSVRLRDNLEPLERWLFSQVGRPWAAVYAELGKIANPNSMHGAHIRQHLWQYVAKNSWFDERGEIMLSFGFGPSAGSWRGRNSYFVHPKTGILLPTGEKSRGKTDGPFPKKARFKKEKQALKSKLRQNVPIRREAQKPGCDVQDWPFFRTRVKSVSPGDRLDFLQGGEIFRAVVQKIDGHERGLQNTNGRWREDRRISLDLKIAAVFAGTNYRIGQAVNFRFFENEVPDWTAFDEKRLFGNQGFGHCFWALAKIPVPPKAN